MSALSVVSHESLGPLDVTILSPTGEDIDFALSSGRTRHRVDVPSGTYAVIARRPNGEQLRRAVEVAGRSVVVDLADQIPPAPTGSMADAVSRGQIRPISRPAPGAGPSHKTLLAGAAARGLANTVSSVLSASSVGDVLGASAMSDLTFDFESVLARNLDRLAARKRQRVLRLRIWRLEQDHWKSHRTADGWTLEESDGFLRVKLEMGEGIHAVGLIDGQGLGPIIMLPPFREAVEVSFVADGLLPRATDRNAIRGGERTPVALVHIRPSAAADMLAALASPRTPRAEDIWEQTAPALLGPTLAIETLLDKYRKPAEALLAAHFLVRFMPTELPLDWAENLSIALPAAADGPVLAAWSWINNPPAKATARKIRNEVHGHVREALNRPAVLFARTRALLFDALDLCGPDTAALGRERHLPFRRAGAAAGGLECFWGGVPASPGKAIRVGENDTLAVLNLDRGAFRGLTA